MGIVAIFGTGGGLLLATVGNTALLVGGITMLACLAAVLLLAPVVALRRPRPVVVRDAESGTPLLEIHRRTRFALATLTYHVQLPGGERLGTLTNDPVRQTVRTVWRTALDGDAGAPITLTEPSALAALGARAVKASLISSVLASLLRAVRTALTRRPPRAALHARRADDPAPLARCVWDDSGHWLWVVFDPGAPLAHRWLILAACLLAVADENG